MPRIYKLLTNSLFVALVVTLAVIFIQDPSVEKYRAVLLDERFFNEGQRRYFNDFDHDGSSEMILLGNNGYSGYPFIMINDIHSKFICQWDCILEWIRRSDLIFGDTDKNGLDELYVFTQSGDTIFINGYEPFTDSVFIFKKLVDIAGRYLGENDLDIRGGRVIDMDNDGFNEVVFVINSGYSVSPRNFYIYYPRYDSISKSPCSGAQISPSPLVTDINRDGYPEVLLDIYAPGNMNDSSDIPFSDFSSWLMVLDHKNRFMFPPVENPGHTSSVVIVPAFYGEQPVLIVYASRGKVPYKKPATLSVYNFYGKRLLSKTKDELGLKYPIRNLFFLDENDAYKSYILDSNLTLYEIENQLYLKKLIRLNPDIEGVIRPSGFNRQNDILLQTKNRQRLYLVKDGIFRHPIGFDILNEGGHFIFNEVCLPGNMTGYSIQSGKNQYLYTYNINPFYYWRFLMYFFIFMVVFLIVHFIKKVQRDQIEKKHDSEKRVLRLQLTSMKNQLNPHFTLNILNSIGGLSQKNQDEADYYFGKYAKLIRQTLMGADKISTTLEEELAFIRNYLDLEKFRFSNRFTYDIENDNPGNLKIQVPRMLIHTFVENAVKHGLKHLKSGGLLKIVITEEKDHIQIEITDNGIGREAAKNMHTAGTGKGLKIVDQMIGIYNQLNNTGVHYSIADGKDPAGNKKGTVVRVFIPKK